MKETLKNIEAFEYYYTLGSNRSYSAVAEYIGVSRRTIEKWGKALGWQSRVEQRDKENGKRLEEITDEAIIEEKLRYHKIIKVGINSFLTNLKEGKVDIDNVRDFSTLVKLDLLLLEGLSVTKEDVDSTIEFVFKGVGVDVDEED